MAFSFGVGSKVEVTFPGVWFLVAYYAGSLLFDFEDGEFYVEFDNLVEADGSSPLKEVVTANQMRPRPPFVNSSSFSIGDLVEVYVHDGWWVGRVTRMFPHSYYDVLLEVDEETVFIELSKMRLHQVWDDGRWVIVVD
ncbi:hypothetical protein RND81_03G037800 [Saponaria officinalis]|uniref:Agenet domain-containing protein n=1 Tax=Saponaria officinalis TaxID=3572 RepID=A0AAW1M2C6_SAPOF